MKIVSRSLKTMLLSSFLCACFYIQAQDTLLFLNFNHPGAASCPEGVNLEVNYLGIDWFGYLNNGCSDTAIIVLAEKEGDHSTLFFGVYLDSSRIKIGDVLHVSFDIISLNLEGVSGNSFYGHFVLGNDYSFDGWGGYVPYPAIAKDSIVTKARLEKVVNVSAEKHQHLPFYFQLRFEMRDSFVFDNFLIVKDVLASTDAGTAQKEPEVLFYYTLEGKQIATPQQGQFVIAMLSTGERHKIIFKQ